MSLHVHILVNTYQGKHLIITRTLFNPLTSTTSLAAVHCPGCKYADTTPNGTIKWHSESGS